MNLVYTGRPDPRPCRDVLGQTIAEIMAADPAVVWLDADLMACSGTAAHFGKDPRYINCGIAEANMIGVGCGLSAAGLKPYAHTFGPFASRRCFDQAFLSGGYAGNHITIVGTDPGITAAFNGGTHMPFEDMALYRTLPGAVVADVTDVPMLVDLLWQARDLPGVVYLRVPRKNVCQVYADGSRFTVGRGCVLREGCDAVIVACGIMVHEALQAAAALAEEGIRAAVLDPVTVKPFDRDLVRQYAEKTRVVVTAENHSRIGGLTGAVQDALCGLSCSFAAVAVEDSFGEVGPQDYLRERFALTAEHIAGCIRRLRKENEAKNPTFCDENIKKA